MKNLILLKRKTIIAIFSALIILSTIACVKRGDNVAITPKVYTTEHVILIVMDGPRYSETWGDTSHQHIPYMENHLAPRGIVNTQFFNNGPTVTNPGHTAMCTGNYQNIDNTGKELPAYPTLFQHWLQQTAKKDSSSAWIITSKDKLEVLSNCTHTEWKDRYRPATNCGINGIGSGYRGDSTTYNKAIEILMQHHPQLVLINLKEPDYSAHIPDSSAYINGIEQSDQYIYQLWQFIESDTIYKGKTTLLYTNDHGRHLDGVSSGYTSHGDNCEGCRHINLYAFGPDFKENVIINTPRELIDISATIAELMHINMPYNKGVVMEELFK